MDIHRVEPDVDLKIVCCILHNICILNEIEMSDYFEDNNAVNPVPLQGIQAFENALVNTKRDNIADVL